MMGKKIPHVGMRMVKSALAVFVCFLIYILRGEQGIPFYSAIAAILCMQQYRENSIQSAKNRTAGTLIGAAYGLIILLINTFWLRDKSMLLAYLLISLTIIPVIYTTVLFNKKQVSYFACVVFLSIVVNHITDENPYIFVLNRVTDTMIGIIVSMIINKIDVPRKYRNDILFLSGIDEVLLAKNGKINPYTLVEINRMIEKGAKFTISTERTTASMLDSVKDIKLKLPVIAFNGAVLFDIKKKQYVAKQVIEKETVNEFFALIENENMCCFATALIQDTLMIYYDEFYNETERRIYESLRTSPYRNYIKGAIDEKAEVIYLMCVDKDERITTVYHKIKGSSIAAKLRLVRVKSTEYPGYTYLKIYDVNASKNNMIEKLKEITGTEKSITFGTIHGQYDVQIKDYSGNMLIKNMRSLYEPAIWKKNK